MDKTENTIKILPDFVANQIAAGEVVQRPESIVKELVENSIDANASEIAVVVKNSGKQLIHIIDNGKGMSRKDLLLSIKRHATSKIISVEDLEQIKTFGFRGEALASIVSVSNVEIRTKQKDNDLGWKLISQPMKQEIIEPINTDVGTQIFVKNLFFNIPARRKFMKSNITEFRYISDTMIKFAISNTNIRFTFYDDDVLIFDTKATDKVQRIRDVLGKKIANSLIPVNYEHNLLTIKGFVGEPLLAKQSRTGQYLFLNNRNIVSKALNHAVFSAFEHLLEKRSHPFFILNLILDPKLVDVNVHPQKHEVKFEDERMVYNLVNRAVNDALQGKNLAPEINLTSKFAQNPIEKFNDGLKNDGEIILVNKLTGEIVEPTIERSKEFKTDTLKLNYTSGQKKDRLDFDNKSSSNNFKTAFDELFSKNTSENIQNVQDNYSHQIKDENFEKSTQMFWQLHNKYIFMQTAKGVMVIDQHAAHERILYEKAIKVMNHEFTNSQQILFPIQVELNSTEISILEEIKKDIKDLGFEFSNLTNKKIEISAIPLDIIAGDEGNSFKSIIDQYSEYDRIYNNSKRDNLAASYGCRSAIKTGHILSEIEMKKLIDNLFKCSMPYVCPHGRPIVIELSLPEFDKRFGRT